MVKFCVCSVSFSFSQCWGKMGSSFWGKMGTSHYAIQRLVMALTLTELDAYPEIDKEKTLERLHNASKQCRSVLSKALRQSY